MLLLVIILLVCVSALCSVCFLIKVLLKHTTVYFFHIWVWGSSTWQYNIQLLIRCSFRYYSFMSEPSLHCMASRELFLAACYLLGFWELTLIFSIFYELQLKNIGPFLLWHVPLSVKPVQDSLFPFSVSKAVFFSQ